MSRLYATCPRGAEKLLAAELRALEVGAVAPARGGVMFSGDSATWAKANLWLRTANQILLQLSRFPADDADALYEGAREIAWSDHLTPEMTFAVAATLSGRNRNLRHSHFVALRIKDAIVDALRDRSGARPSVDRQDPHLRVHVHHDGQNATVSLNTSGESLHRRGYRPPGAAAPMKETLAAAMILLAGYDGSQPLIDPMCGSGTLLVEAALLGRRMAPGRRRTFGFERWIGFDAAGLRSLREQAASLELEHPGAPIRGSDSDGDAIRLALDAARSAGVDADLDLRRGDVQEARPPGPPPGLVLCNPPYGERLGASDQLDRLYRRIGETLKRHFGGYCAWILSGQESLGRAIGLAPRRKIRLFNGPLQCELLEVPLYTKSTSQIGR